jgi:carboxylesterase type B
MHITSAEFSRSANADRWLHSVNQYFGIRYAAPPLGELRWRAPMDIESHGGYDPSKVLRECRCGCLRLAKWYSSLIQTAATERGPICVQGAPYWRNNPTLNSTGSEDCLLLDILTPPDPVNGSLPVLVQMYTLSSPTMLVLVLIMHHRHGGGYDQGNSESNPGYLLVNQSQNQLIYVSIQYRLDAFGFLSSSEIRENGDANVGLLDQRAALNWV